MGSNGKRKNELREELERIDKMNPYERLHHIKKLAEFHLQFTDMIDEDFFKSFLKDLLRITKGY